MLLAFHLNVFFCKYHLKALQVFEASLQLIIIRFPTGVNYSNIYVHLCVYMSVET